MKKTYGWTERLNSFLKFIKTYYNWDTAINVNGKKCSKSDACQFKTQWSEDDDDTANEMKKLCWEPFGLIQP
jgi:hypothetical protein